MTQKTTLKEELQKIKTTAKVNINNDIPITRSRLINQMRACIETALSEIHIRAPHLLPKVDSNCISIFFERKLSASEVDSVFNGIFKQHHLITQNASMALKIPILARPSKRLEEILPTIQKAIDEKENTVNQTAAFVSGISAAAA